MAYSEGFFSGLTKHKYLISPQLSDEFRSIVRTLYSIVRSHIKHEVTKKFRKTGYISNERSKS